MAYLIDNPPRRDQFRSPRRARPTGLTVIHTAESILDVIGPDTGAENVASYMTRRTTPGSYHDLCDSDTALQLVRYGDEAYQDGTGSNPYALSISFALRTTDWARMPDADVAAFLAQGAKAFARQQAWLRASGYPMTPLKRVTRAQSSAGVAGFISHAERDPERRSDPGADFPWDEWFTACAHDAAGHIFEEDDMQADERKWLADIHTHITRGHTAALIGARIRAIDQRTAALLAGGGADVDEQALAAALAPLLDGVVRTVSDTDLAGIADAVADETARRQVG